MNLLLTGCFKYSEEQMQALRSLGYTIYFMQQEKKDLPLEASEVDATVCNGLFLSHDIAKFARLKFIQLTSAGFDRVPVEKIKERGIELYNARGVYSTPMAEWAIFRVLEHDKQGWFFRKEQESSRWTKHRGLREVAGTKVAVVGAGNVGQEVAKRFQAFGAETTGFDIHTNDTSGFNHMDLTENFRGRVGEFDVVVVTAPLLPSTRGLISREVLLTMKQNAILVNIARGGLIDEQAMCEVLDVLPEDYPQRDKILELFRAHVRCLAACQSGEGFWHQLLDRNDSYLETSATAIYVYCFAHAINKGWIDAMAYGPVAQLGWHAVTTQINAEGQVDGTCVGTGMAFDPAFYYYRPVNVYAAHGYGPVLWAGAEMINLLNKQHPKMNDSAVQYYRTEQKTSEPIFHVMDGETK